MLWLPFVGVILTLVFERIYRAGTFGFAGGLLAGLALLLADHLPLDPSISPVAAVLRSNLWLTIHVLTIVGSYAPLSLAAVLAHVYGGLYLARGGRHPGLALLNIFLYRLIQVGVVLLAAGIMLGAVWANASWGRYWGWDPKETWSLITLLWFLALLHGRFAGWLRGVGFSLGIVAGFLLLLMTYYGVSFYLAGLHSYAGGHAKPLPPPLAAYVAAEVAFVAAVTRAVFRERKRL
jgi:ABC-type transport system involved in cytochrome c biogenesis permease subunit